MGRVVVKEYKSLALRLTNRCNLHCSMCGQAKLTDICKNEELSLQSIQDAVQLLAGNNKNIQVYLWGGEPLLYSRFKELLYYLAIAKINSFITTNGVLLDRYIEAIVDNRVTEICVSMDGLGDDYDKIRGGRGLFDKMIQNLQKLIDYKKYKNKVFPIIDINFVILPDNYEKIYDFVQEITKLKIARRIRLQYPMWFTETMSAQFKSYVRQTFGADNVGSSETFVSTFNIDLAILEKQLQKVDHDFPQVLFFPDNMCSEKWFLEPEFTNRRSCHLCKYRVNVEPNGDIITCTDFPETKVGNLYHEPLEDILDCHLLKKHSDHVEHDLIGICSRCSSLYLF